MPDKNRPGNSSRPVTSPQDHPQQQGLQTSQGPDPTVGLSADPEFIGKAAEYLRPLLRNPEEAPKAAATVVATAEFYSGLLPHPRHLAEYDKLVPGAARDIMEMTKGEQRHRHRMQLLEMIYPYLGWFSGTIGLFLCLGLATYLTLHEHERVAYAMLGVTVLGVIGWFIQARIAPGSNDSGQ